MRKYRLISKKGEGTFSEVLKAQSVKNGKCFAIKCMKTHFSSIDQVNSLREIQALRRLTPHPNIVKLEEVLYDPPTGRLALVFELMDMNLYELIRGRRHYLDSQLVKIYMYQLLRALAHMHKKAIFHRDLKPENILIENSYDVHTGLKLADFGSCRGMYSKQPFTEYISTRWYRAPECLLTDGYYGAEMDMWGVGCVMFEISCLYPLFPGNNELDQIKRIHSVLGTPTPKVLEFFKSRASAHVSLDFTPQKGSGLRKTTAHLPPAAADLIAKLLAYDPRERITAAAALDHEYFADLRAVPTPPMMDATGMQFHDMLSPKKSPRKTKSKQVSNAASKASTKNNSPSSTAAAASKSVVGSASKDHGSNSGAGAGATVAAAARKAARNAAAADAGADAADDYSDDSYDDDAQAEGKRSGKHAAKHATKRSGRASDSSDDGAVLPLLNASKGSASMAAESGSTQDRAPRLNHSYGQVTAGTGSSPNQLAASHGAAESKHNHSHGHGHGSHVQSHSRTHGHNSSSTSSNSNNVYHTPAKYGNSKSTARSGYSHSTGKKTYRTHKHRRSHHKYDASPRGGGGGGGGGGGHSPRAQLSIGSNHKAEERTTSSLPPIHSQLSPAPAGSGVRQKGLPNMSAMPRGAGNKMYGTYKGPRTMSNSHTDAQLGTNRSSYEGGGGHKYGYALKKQGSSRLSGLGIKGSSSTRHKHNDGGNTNRSRTKKPVRSSYAQYFSEGR